MFWALPTVLSMAKDATTGLLPSFNTTAKTKRYDLDTSIRSVRHVCVQVGQSLESLDLLSQDYGIRTNRQLALERRIIFGYEYAIIPYVSSTSKIGTAPARVLFSIDPGTTTAQYSVWGYTDCGDLTSVSTPLSIPSPFDEEFLIPAASEYIHGISHGDIIKTRSNILKVLGKEYALAVNKDAMSGLDEQPERRGF